jgi:hypothetical protein
MPDLWFFAGLAVGVAITGFCAVGSFDRGADSMRRRTWQLEFAARQTAFFASERGANVVSRPSARQVAINAFDGLVRNIDRLRGEITRRVTREAELVTESSRAPGQGM